MLDELQAGLIPRVLSRIRNGETFPYEAFLYCVEKSNIRVIREALQYGANPAMNNNQLLITAASCGHLDIVRLLLDYGADISAGNNTPLRAAIYSSRCSTVRYFLDHINPLSNSAVAWIMRVCVDRNHVKLLRILIGEYHIHDSIGLRIASELGRIEIIHLLLEHGADPAECNHDAVKRAYRARQTEAMHALANHVSLGDKYRYHCDAILCIIGGESNILDSNAIYGTPIWCSEMATHDYIERVMASVARKKKATA
jgi:hypothetical protein